MLADQFGDSGIDFGREGEQIFRFTFMARIVFWQAARITPLSAASCSYPEVAGAFRPLRAVLLVWRRSRAW
jgi:hypothetical protein